MEDPASGSPFERLQFGPSRTLNVRASMLSGPTASARVESWLRSKQVEHAGGEVLIITGRGKGSPGGVAVVREATRKVLTRLRRSGVIASYGEESAGSFVATLAPLRALLEAPARRGTPAQKPLRKNQTIHGLRDETQFRLRYLAERALHSLGVIEASEAMIATEMARQFSVLARTSPESVDTDRWLDGAIARASREYDES